VDQEFESVGGSWVEFELDGERLESDSKVSD
jgi:hypothetical protein